MKVDQFQAIVPVNVPSKSKVRLSPVLNPRQRALLTTAMLTDVLTALQGSRRISEVTVVSADPRLRVVAQKYNAGFLWEGKRRGLNRGLRLAVSKAIQQGECGALIIHADLPMVKGPLIDRLIKQAGSYAVTIVQSKDGEGTNAMFLRPPDVIPPRFGKNSLTRHLFQAKLKRIRARVIKDAAFGFDVDNPRDLEVLLRGTVRNNTGRFLRTLPEQFPIQLSRRTTRLIH